MKFLYKQTPHQRDYVVHLPHFANQVLQDTRRETENDKQPINQRLRQKMDIMTWLARSSNFLSDTTSESMVAAYRGSECSHDQRNRYSKYITHSAASVSIVEIVNKALGTLEFMSKPEDFDSLSPEGGKFILK